MNEFTLTLENDKLINCCEFIDFCWSNQNKDISLKLNQESHCLTYCGIYDILDRYNFNSVVIESFNKLETHDRYIIKNPRSYWNSWIEKFMRMKPKFDKPWNRKKIFGALYSRPTANRLGIMGHLLDKHDDISLIKFRSDLSNPDIRQRAEINKLFEWDLNAGHKIQLVADNNDKILSDYPAYTVKTGYYNFKTNLHDLYEDFLIDVVSEAVMYGNSFYPTEKVCRPLAFQRPFVVMASREYLKNLRNLGFKTFNNHWDESYDDLEGADRYHAILDLIDKISKLSLDDVYKDMEPILKHNRDLII